MPWPCSKTLPTQASAGDFWRLTGKSVSISCGATAPFSQSLVGLLLLSLYLVWGHCSFLSISCGVTAPFALSRVGSLLLSLYLLWGHCSFLLGPGAHKILFVPSKSLFSSPAEVLQTNPTGLQSQISRGFSVPLPDIQVGESVVGPRTFATMWKLLW